MKLPLYQVDAFTSELFAGNPAAVCPLDNWLDDGTLQAIAAENNLSESAFLVRSGAAFELRWFTPLVEVSLCGHATLASAYVVFNLFAWQEDTVSFHTRRSGILSVARKGDLLEMDFPARPASPTRKPPGLEQALGSTAAEVLGSKEDLLVILENERTVRGLKPDFAALGTVEHRGVIVSARGERSDFVSRFFAPLVGIPEDPVTGSAHCVLVPYWARALGKRDLHALQVSKRGGELFCRERGERVSIAGRAVLYLEGTITIPGARKN
jgi:PhzF family phenazine biosynthesis protein